MAQGPNRRQFLAGSSAAIAATMLAGIDRLRAANQQEIEQQARPGSDLPSAYSLDRDVVYLNHASIGTIPRAVQSARQGYLDLCESNPWFYVWGGEWEQPREQVRQEAARLMGGQASEIALTHNTTEAFNVFAQGLPLGPADEVLFSTLNHDGASVCFQQRAERGRYQVRRFDFPLDDIASITTDQILQRYADAIRPATRVLALPHIDNRVGLRHPVAELTRLARDRGVEFVLVDGAQAVGMIPVDVVALGADAYATSPHKWLQAPKGLGVTHLHADLIQQLQPMWVTWGQRRWAGSARIFEDYGTRNLPEVLALGDAIRFQQSLGLEHNVSHHRRLWRHAQERVDASPGLEWASPRDWSLSASLFSIRLQQGKASEVAAKLFTEQRIVVRPFDDLNALRVSPNVANSERDLDRFVAALG